MNALSNPDTPEVLCSITTAASIGDPSMDWRIAVQDTVQLGIKRFALFLTGLKPTERKNCYQLLLTHRLRHEFEIPFVHARSDMHPDEYRFLMHEFGTKRFNLHPVRKAELPEGGLPDDLRRLIYIENVGKLLESDLNGFAGICLDISHLEITRRVYPEYYPTLCAMIENHRVGANHVSAYQNEGKGDGRDDKHHYVSITEFDYLKAYPKEYFGRYVAIELTNPLSEQLAVKSLLENHLNLI
ncbi:hypothetical protein HZC53_05070 [Candidatus Uhrbacteria bacterium]|nr:hypothetical protein [Candidatus Uhrbacteria bacterium]